MLLMMSQESQKQLGLGCGRVNNLVFIRGLKMHTYDALMMS